MKDRMLAFLSDIDHSLVGEAAGEVLKLYHIGRSALVWKYDYAATTSDFDVVDPDRDDNSRRLLGLALTLFGKNTPKANEHGLYLEEVPAGLPPLPGGYRKRASRAEGPWQVIELYHLGPYDLILSKLRRFAAKDRQDVQQLCDWEDIDPDELERILGTMLLRSERKDGADDDGMDVHLENLRVVQKYLRGEISEL
jgi:hypothetical protein